MEQTDVAIIGAGPIGLELAVAHGLRSIAFPAISCGVYGFPIADAAIVAMGTTIQFLSGAATLERVIFTCSSEEVESSLKNAYQEIQTDD